MLVQDLCLTTVTVPDDRMDDFATIYRQEFGWNTRWDGTLDRMLAASLGIEPRRSLLLGPADESRGLVRFVAGPTPPPPPLATPGWAALEITVRDVDGLSRQLHQSPHFRVNGEPRDLRFGQGPPGQRAMQAVGPGGTQLYLTQILRQSPGSELAVPPAGADVGSVFIAVLATSDYASTCRLYAVGLGMRLYIDIPKIVLSVTNRERAVSPQTTYRIGALRPAGETRIEIDGYPENVPMREHRQGELPAGFSVATFSVSTLDEAIDSLGRAGYQPAAGPISVDHPPYGGRKSAIYVGAAGEIVELLGLE